MARSVAGRIESGFETLVELETGLKHDAHVIYKP